MKNTNKGIINLKNIGSLIQLKSWANKYIKKDINSDELEIIIEYLKDRVRDSGIKDKSLWLNSLSDLLKRLEVEKNEEG